MRVITATTEGVRPDARRTRALNLELLGLLATSVLVLFGFVLAFAGKSARIDEGTTEPVVALYALKGPSDLEPLLTMVASLPERQKAANAIYQRATQKDAPLEHVGGLSGILAPADLAALKPHLTVRSAVEFRERCARAFVWVLAAFWIAHAVRRWRRRDDDPVLLPVVMILCGIGMMTMLSLRDPLRDTMAIGTFCGGIVAGIAVLLMASEVDFEASRLRRAVILPLGAAVGLAAALLLFWLRARGERRESESSRRPAGGSDPSARRLRARGILRPPLRASAIAV